MTELFKICGKLVNPVYYMLIYIELSVLASGPEIVVRLVLQRHLSNYTWFLNRYI